MEGDECSVRLQKDSAMTLGGKRSHFTCIFRTNLRSRSAAILLQANKNGGEEDEGCIERIDRAGSFHHEVRLAAMPIRPRLM